MSLASRRRKTYDKHLDKCKNSVSNLRNLGGVIPYNWRETVEDCMETMNLSRL
jgi:hypothetical protein